MDKIKIHGILIIFCIQSTPGKQRIGYTGPQCLPQMDFQGILIQSIQKTSVCQIQKILCHFFITVIGHTLCNLQEPVTKGLLCIRFPVDMFQTFHDGLFLFLL